MQPGIVRHSRDIRATFASCRPVGHFRWASSGPEFADCHSCGDQTGRAERKDSPGKHRRWPQIRVPVTALRQCPRSKGGVAVRSAGLTDWIDRLSSRHNTVWRTTSQAAGRPCRGSDHKLLHGIHLRHNCREMPSDSVSPQALRIRFCIGDFSPRETAGADWTRAWQHDVHSVALDATRFLIVVCGLPA